MMTMLNALRVGQEYSEGHSVHLDTIRLSNPIFRDRHHLTFESEVTEDYTPHVDIVNEYCIIPPDRILFSLGPVTRVSFR